jgi:hypothetical protein
MCDRIEYALASFVSFGIWDRPNHWPVLRVSRSLAADITQLPERRQLSSGVA